MSTSLKEIKFLEDLPDQVLIIDKFKSINYANKAAKNHFGARYRKSKYFKHCKRSKFIKSNRRCL